MTSTSTDRVVLRDVPEEHLTAGPGGTDLRSGHWTRLGSATVLGDRVAEAALGRLADAANSAARAQGYARGWAEGRSAALALAAAEQGRRDRDHQDEQARAVAEVRTAARALVGAAERCDDAIRRHLDELAASAVDLALQLAEAVLEREVRTAGDPGADALRRALAALPGEVPVTVRLHPDDLAALDPGWLDGRVSVCPDPCLARGDAVAETDRNLVDATLAGALARVREVLAP